MHSSEHRASYVLSEQVAKKRRGEAIEQLFTMIYEHIAKKTNEQTRRFVVAMYTTHQSRPSMPSVAAEADLPGA